VSGAADLVARLDDRLADLGADRPGHRLSLVAETIGQAMQQIPALGRGAEAEGGPSLARLAQGLGDGDFVRLGNPPDQGSVKRVEHLDLGGG
jgi:hypothetical protein